MSNPSNLYAEKVFAEHPTVLWALDDTADYISLITEQQRNFSSWTFDNCSGSNYLDALDEPFVSSSVIKIVGDEPAGDYETASAIGPNIVNCSELNKDKETFWNYNLMD